ncbi:acyl carrier protein [Fulvivirga sp. M361]|uniref:acyl carrier protein n=1 Tax=Fulvivirga sp. M361 TaxID=2594266 RepID=UPI00162669E6|nr:acyl carrier protein [Fulvivirga sp. M361]
MDNAQEIVTFMKALASEELRTSANEIDENATFHELGFDSISSIYLLEKLEKKYEIELSPLYFWDFPTIALLSEQVKKEIK